MCAYCGHISKRPVLDLPVPPGLGLSNSGILKDLVGKSGKILNGKAWTDNGWICGQDWLDNGNWVAGSFTGKPSHWPKNGGGVFGSDDHCLAEKSYYRIVIFSGKALSAFFLSILWLWRKIFRISSSDDDASVDAEQRRMLARRGENGANCQESKGEKARRKAEEKRQARLEREQLEEEERKQREEVARLVEERRKLRDEKTEAEKDRGRCSPSARGKDARKEAEKKRQDRKKEKDRCSSKSNSDAEEIERRTGTRKSDADSREDHKTENAHVLKSNNNTTNTYNRNAGSRYLDRMRGTLLSSSRAIAGSSFFSKSTNSSGSISQKPNGSLDHIQISNNRKDFSQSERVPVKSNVTLGEDKNTNHPVLIESQPNSAPKKSWQQLFIRSSSVPPSSTSNVISRPKTEIHSPPLPESPSAQKYENPINFGLPSPFTLSSFPYTSSTSTNTTPILPPESMYPRKTEACEFLPEESDIFEDPCYVPDPVSLLGPVSESLDNFQLDLGFVTDMGLVKPRGLKNVSASPEVSRPSPIESPMSRFRVSEERQHSNSYLFPNSSNINNNNHNSQEIHNMRMNDSNEKGAWQMWNSSPLGQDIIHSVPQKSMASLFKNDEQVSIGTHSPQKGIIGSCQNGGKYHSGVVPCNTDESWLPKNLFGPIENHHSSKHNQSGGGVMKSDMIYGSMNGSASNHVFELSPINPWAKKDWNMQQQQQQQQQGGEGNGNSPVNRAAVGGLYSSPDVQSLWSYD
jgi:flagellar biosynthesis GTPase FlhF